MTWIYLFCAISVIGSLLAVVFFYAASSRRRGQP